MHWSGKLGTVAALTATVVFGVAAQAQATVPPQNVGWLYTQGASGAVYFDADLAGYASEEKITICDNKSDGRGIAAQVTGTSPDGRVAIYYNHDPSNDGHCVSSHGNYFADGYAVYVHVWEYWGDNTANDAYGDGVA